MKTLTGTLDSLLRGAGLAALVLISALPAMCGQRVVDLTAPDGTKLKATYFDAGRPGPGVLLLHQCNRDRKVWDGLAAQLTEAGMNVLTVDNRGFGESGGTPHDRLSQADEGKVEAEKWPGDFDAALAYLESQTGVDRNRIGVGGASCGVNNSIQLARRHPEVISLVLLSGPTDLNGRTYLHNSAKTPVFFAAADDDEFGSQTEIEWLYAATSNPGKQFVRYAKGAHGADMFPAHPELPGLIANWYVITLIKTPGRAPVQKNSPTISAAARNLDLIDHPGGAAKVAAKLAEARKTDPKATLFPEVPVNLMGYEQLQAGHTQEAIEIFNSTSRPIPNRPTPTTASRMHTSRQARRTWPCRTSRKPWNSCPATRRTPRSFARDFRKRTSRS